MIAIPQRRSMTVADTSARRSNPSHSNRSEKSAHSAFGNISYARLDAVLDSVDDLFGADVAPSTANSYTLIADSFALDL